MQQLPGQRPPVIYDHQSFAAYFSAFLRYQKAINRKFSYEFFARRLGLRSRSLLAMIASGSRLPADDVFEKLCEAAGFTAEEKTYASLLVAAERAKTLKEKEYVLANLEAMRPAVKALVIQDDSFRFISNWLHCAVFELAALADFRPEPDWIASRLAFPATGAEVTECLDRLVRLGLLVKSENGQLSRATESVQSISEVPSLALRAYHRSFLGIAADALEMQAVSKRYFSGISFTLDREQMDQAKALIVEFERRFVKLLQKPKGDATYHLEIAFFALSKDEESGPASTHGKTSA